MRGSIRIGFVGDPHIGRCRRWVDEERALAMHREALAYSFALCRRHRCTHAVVLGDTFDTPNPTRDEQALVIRELARVETEVLLIMGNHDVQDAATNALTVLREIPAAGGLTHVTFALEPVALRWEGWRVVGLPWGHRVPCGGADVLAFHDAVPGALRDNHTRSPGGLRGVREYARVGVGGHLHTPQGGPDVAFAGTIAQLSFGERAGKSFWHLTLRPGREPRLERVPVASPWTLERVRYDAHDPPRCNAARTFYALDVSDERPGPRWMTDHPAVVSTVGGSAARAAERQQRVVSLIAPSGTERTSDRALLNRWLRHYAPLTDVQRVRALRVHDRSSGGSDEEA